MEYRSTRLSSSAQTFLSILEYNKRISNKFIRLKKQPSFHGGLNNIKK